MLLSNKSNLWGSPKNLVNLINNWTFLPSLELTSKKALGLSLVYVIGDFFPKIQGNS
jgi:hypothetical protein